VIGGGRAAVPCSAVQVRLAKPEEYEPLAELTARAYWAIDPGVLGEYEDELRAVEWRATVADVLVAVDDDGKLLGGVTYVGDQASPAAEFGEPAAAGIRMLAVSPAAQGRGVGEALSRACVERARAAGKARVRLHSATWMTTAHRLYERLGFERDPAEDWTPRPGVDLLAYRLDL
jgi:GNAT superfamily N-acetyltransferase